MRLKCFLGLMTMPLIIGSLNGCYSTADGGTKAGMPWLKDSVVGRYERPVDQIFEAAIEVIRFNGAIESENSINHSLIGRIDTRKIWVQVQEESPTITRVEVQSRTKYGRPDVDLASEIEKQIALQLMR